MTESELPPDVQEHIERLKDIGFGYVLAIVPVAPEEPGFIVVQPIKAPAPDSPEKRLPEIPQAER